MKNLLYILAISILPAAIAILPAAAAAQYNCSIYKDSSHARACRLLNAADSFYQGSPKCQHYLDSAIAICHDYAPVWRELAVPYLKRGDFATWRRLMDTAVKYDPMFLAYRGWCRFEFLRDYKGALEDLKKYDTLSEFSHTESINGDYELHIAMALAERQLHNIPAALHYFSVAMDKDSAEAGLYGYLHLGVTKYLAKDYPGAIAALEHENRIYDKFAETWFYLAKVYAALARDTAQAREKSHNLALAREYLLHARDLLADSSGVYHLHEVYCELLDTVYPADIDQALTDLQP